MALQFLNNGYFAGKVGIGIETPDSTLHVAGPSTLASQGTVLKIESTADQGSSQDIHIYNQYDRDIGIKFETLGGTNYIWQDSNGDDALILSSGGANRTNDATLILKQDHNVFVPNGKVGIGTISPDANLEVESSTGGVLRLTSSDTTVLTGESIGKIEFKSNDASTGGDNVMGFINSIATNVGTRYALSFGTGDAAAAVERMNINNLGSVKFNNYDSTNQTGTATYLLGTDASGNVVKTTTVPSGSGGPYLPLAGNTTATALTGDVYFANQQQVRFLTSANAIGLRMQSSGTSSFIDNEVGIMYIRQEADDNDMIFQADDGLGGNATYFFLDGSEADGTGNLYTNFPDKSRLTFGDNPNGDLQIYHTGDHSFIQDVGTGMLAIDTNGTDVRITKTDSEFMAKFVTDAEVQLYYNGSKKFETTSTGVNVTGDVVIDSALLSNQENTDIDSAAAEMVAQVATTSYNAAFFDFVVKKGTNVRSGTVYACHDGTNVEFTETSTQDLGDTLDVVLSVDISGGNMRLMATVASDDWSVKSLIRAI